MGILINILSNLIVYISVFIRGSSFFTQPEERAFLLGVQRRPSMSERSERIGRSAKGGEAPLEILNLLVDFILGRITQF